MKGRGRGIPSIPPWEKRPWKEKIPTFPRRREKSAFSPQVTVVCASRLKRKKREGSSFNMKRKRRGYSFCWGGKESKKGGVKKSASRLQREDLTEKEEREKSLSLKVTRYSLNRRIDEKKGEKKSPSRKRVRLPFKKEKRAFHSFQRRIISQSYGQGGEGMSKRGVPKKKEEVDQKEEGDSMKKGGRRKKLYFPIPSFGQEKKGKKFLYSGEQGGFQKK